MLCCFDNFLRSLKYIPENVKHVSVDNNPISETFSSSERILELSGTSKFRILGENVEKEDSYLKWFRGNKISLERLYDLF